MGKTRELFKKITDTKGTFHAKMGSIKDRNDMDLTFQVPMQYCSLQHQTLTSITSHIHNWVLFLLWFRLFILSVFISPLISSSILGTYQVGEFIFQCPIFLPLHTVRGVPKARIVTWFAIPFSRGPRFVRTPP